MIMNSLAMMYSASNPTGADCRVILVVLQKLLAAAPSDLPIVELDI